MLIYVTDYLTQLYSGFNVFSYLTTRAILSALTALVLSFAFGPYLIQKPADAAASASRSARSVPRAICRKPARRRWAAR